MIYDRERLSSLLFKVKDWTPTIQGNTLAWSITGLEEKHWTLKKAFINPSSRRHRTNAKSYCSLFLSSSSQRPLPKVTAGHTTRSADALVLCLPPLFCSLSLNFLLLVLLILLSLPPQECFVDKGNFLTCALNLLLCLPFSKNSLYIVRCLSETVNLSTSLLLLLNSLKTETQSILI